MNPDERFESVLKKLNLKSTATSAEKHWLRCLFDAGRAYSSEKQLEQLDRIKATQSLKASL